MPTNRRRQIYTIYFHLSLLEVYFVYFIVSLVVEWKMSKYFAVLNDEIKGFI